MGEYTFGFQRFELILLVSALCICNVTFCTTTTNLNPSVTTLASELNLVDNTKFYIIAGAVLAGIPISVLFCCLVRSIALHRREQKITDDDDPYFQHPAPSHPPPRHFLRRDNTIAGPFMNPAFADDGDGAYDRSRVVTPSFVSTRIVNENTAVQKKYQYIP